MNQLTLRQIPEEVDRELRQQASRNGTSLNQTVIVVLRQGLGLAGRWVERYERTNSKFVNKNNDLMNLYTKVIQTFHRT